jgi:hypothetical protein
MQEYLIEFDVPLWTYVLYYQGQKYVLNTLNIVKAKELAEIKLLYLKRQETNASQTTSS